MTTDHFRQAAGWYTDPDSPGERWWNGSQWTSHRRSETGAHVPTRHDDIPLEGGSPTAWSASDYPTTAHTPPEFPLSGFPADPLVQQRVRPLIAAGWYPDPQGLPAQRWWDGSQWSAHTAPTPAAAPYPGAPAYRGYPGYQGPPGYPATTVVVLPPRKSVGVALLLTFFFGPFGMFYSTVGGALVMLAASIFGSLVVGVLTLGLGWLVWGPAVWVVCMVWGCLAAASQPEGARVSHY